MKKRWYRGSICFATVLMLTPMLAMPQPAFAKVKRKVEKQYFIVSRMEEDIVLLENQKGVEQQTSKSKLPKRIKEGDVLAYYKGKYRIDRKKTKERKKRIEAYMAEFWK